jgi:hypothetical protein
MGLVLRKARDLSAEPFIDTLTEVLDGLNRWHVNGARMGLFEAFILVDKQGILHSDFPA